MVPNSSEDITRAMRGQLKPLCRNYLGRNGGNVIVYVLISFHSRDVFSTLSCLFVPPGFRLFVLVWLFIIWPFIRFQIVKALAYEDTLLPTQMFPRLPARATFVADTNFVSGTQKMFLILFRNILCPQQMFPSLRSMETQHSFFSPARLRAQETS